MAYATASDVQAEFKDVTFSTSTAVSSTDVASFLEQEEATLNGLLSPVYTVPITGTMALSICKMLLIKLVKARIVAIMRVKTGGKTPDQGDSEDQTLREEVMTLIEKLVKKEMLLPDAAYATANGAVRSYVAENDIEPTVRKAGDQW